MLLVRAPPPPPRTRTDGVAFAVIGVVVRRSSSRSTYCGCGCCEARGGERRGGGRGGGGWLIDRVGEVRSPSFLPCAAAVAAWGPCGGPVVRRELFFSRNGSGSGKDGTIRRLANGGEGDIRCCLRTLVVVPPCAIVASWSGGEPYQYFQCGGGGGPCVKKFFPASKGVERVQSFVR
jgi:hypothetical protein